MATIQRLLLRQSPHLAASTSWYQERCFYHLRLQHASLSRRFMGIATGGNKKTKIQGQHLRAVYEKMIEKEGIKEDVHQLKALKELDRLYAELENCTHPPLQNNSSSTASDNKQESSSTSFWGSLFSSVKVEPSVVPANKAVSAPKGVYIHGGVGSGKTFCMNMFYDNLPGNDKQQVHFHKFMLRSVHQQMHEAKMIDGIKSSDDVLRRVVERILEQGRIICFDEFQVTDVADAMILRLLFTSLLEQGAVIVATSNRPPQDLYLNGLQRDRFLPFIDVLEQRLNVVSVWDSETDYRLINEKAKGVYFVGEGRRTDFEDVYHSLTKDSVVAPTNLSTQGRLVPIPKASVTKGVARFDFNDLCTKALGAADYLVIGQHFHTVFVDNVPTMTRDQINWVRRFIVFVDSMYESHVKLIVQAETEPDGIFTVDLEDASCDEVFAFDRTRSRLEEMRSERYLKKRWAGAAGEQSSKPNKDEDDESGQQAESMMA